MKRLGRAVGTNFGLVVRALLVALAVVWPSLARAQGAPQLQLQAEADVAGVGDVVHVELSATSAETMPGEPQLKSSPGFVVRGQSASPTQTHIIINGARTDRYTLTVTWALEARRVGSFAVGPASVVVGGSRFESREVTIRVVPAAQAPPRARQQQQQLPQFPFGFSPFDPWKGLVPGFDGEPTAPDTPAPVTIDPKLSLDAPRGGLYFLHATMDKSSAVVGEQVTYSVYEYIDSSATNLEVDGEDVHDSQAADFVKHPLLREDQEAVQVGHASVGGRTWDVKLVRRWALFPLRAGDLAIGPMSVGLLRPRSVAGQKRTTETLHVAVSEPPLAGRPPGYVVGDVGRFTITAQVDPRQAEQGGAVGVHVEVSGRGSIPLSLAVPAREGIEWLAPEVHDQLGPVGHDVFGGKRTFDYVVRLKRQGDVDLGEFALPFWDSDQRRYDVARAALGTVHVTGAPGASASASTDTQEMLPGLPAPRRALAGEATSLAHADDRPAFWLVRVAAWPLLFAFAFVARALGRRLADAWARRRASPARDLKERIAAANAASGKKDARLVDAATYRALEAAAVAHRGVSVRDAVGAEVVSRLETAGVARDAASGIADLLRECEAARFAPDAADVVAARDRWVRAQGAIRTLEKRG
jgi:hypothetical protein